MTNMCEVLFNDYCSSSLQVPQRPAPQETVVQGKSPQAPPCSIQFLPSVRPCKSPWSSLKKAGSWILPLVSAQASKIETCHCGVLCQLDKSTCSPQASSASLKLRPAFRHACRNSYLAHTAAHGPIEPLQLCIMALKESAQRLM